MRTLIAIAALIVGSAQAADRFPVLTPEQLTPEQQKLVQALIAGPRGGGDAGKLGEFLERCVHLSSGSGSFSPFGTGTSATFSVIDTAV